MDARTSDKPALWVDVGTMTGWRGNPTGIARTLGQILHHWLADERLPIRLCRHDPVRQLYLEVDPARFRSTPPPPPAPASTSPSPHTLSTGTAWRSSATRLPSDVDEACWHLHQAAKSLGRRGRAAVQRLWRSSQRMLTRLKKPLPGVRFSPGDALFIAGAGWKDSPPPSTLQELRVRYGLRIAQLIYDIIPLRCPHLCYPNLTRDMTRWLPEALACSDLILTISGHSLRDLEEFGRQQALPLPPLARIRLGDEPGSEQAESPPPDLLGSTTGPYVLCVSTLGLNKNHHLLFQVWRRLLDRHGGGVPSLVLAGAPGWRADQILRDLRADLTLARHVVHLPRVTDRHLRWLYRHCLFTVFPSHYEGWGLPVAESLVHGKACLASNAASLPEVGGSLVDYFDPLDGSTCLALIEKALLEPAWLAAREEAIRRDFRVTPWKSCAQHTFEILDNRFALRPLPQSEAA